MKKATTLPRVPVPGQGGDDGNESDAGEEDEGEDEDIVLPAERVDLTKQANEHAGLTFGLRVDELPDIDFTAMWRRRLEQEKGAGAATARGQRGCARCGAQVTQGIKHVLLGECVHAHVAPELKDIAREMHAIKAYLIKKQEPRDSPQIKMLQTAADAIARWAYSQKTVTNEEWKCISKVWAGVLPACRRQREDKDKKAVAEAVTQKIIGIQTTLASTPQGVAGNHRQGAKGISTPSCHRRRC